MAKLALPAKRFLIVDDVRVTRISTLKMLKGIAGEESYHAENGQEGLNVLEEKSMYIDCVLVDFNMPVMHGLKMVKNIRCGYKGIRRDLPIIMVTGHGDRSLLGVSLELDVNAFILKPFDREGLLKRIIQVFEVIKSGEEWLKPVDEYRRIDVDDPVQGLLDSVKGDRRISYSEEVTKTREQDIETRIVSKNPENVTATTNAPLTPNESECTVDTLAVGQTLSRDILGSAGQKLLAKESVVTRNTLARLKNLQEMGEPLDTIVIKKAVT